MSFFNCPFLAMSFFVQQPLPLGGGVTPQSKKKRVLVRKFSKRLLFCACGLKLSWPLSGTNFKQRIISCQYCFRYNSVKCVAKAPSVDLLSVNTVRDTYRSPPPPPGADNVLHSLDFCPKERIISCHCVGRGLWTGERSLSCQLDWCLSICFWVRNSSFSRWTSTWTLGIIIIFVKYFDSITTDIKQTLTLGIQTVQG